MIFESSGGKKYRDYVLDTSRKELCDEYYVISIYSYDYYVNFCEQKRNAIFDDNTCIIHCWRNLWIQSILLIRHVPITIETLISDIFNKENSNKKCNSKLGKKCECSQSI